MRKFILIALACALGMLIATPVSADSDDRRVLPFYANTSGFLGVFIFDPYQIAERCSIPDGKAGAWAIASFEGSGFATYLGYSHITAEHCSYFVDTAPDGTPIPDGTYGQGVIEITAANNDVLLATYDNGNSYPDGPLIRFMDEFTFVDGGTGRFSCVSGGGIEMGSVNFGDNTFVAEIFGVISFSRGDSDDDDDGCESDIDYDDDNDRDDDDDRDDRDDRDDDDDSD